MLGLRISRSLSQLRIFRPISHACASCTSSRALATSAPTSTSTTSTSPSSSLPSSTPSARLPPSSPWNTHLSWHHISASRFGSDLSWVVADSIIERPPYQSAEAVSKLELLQQRQYYYDVANYHDSLMLRAAHRHAQKQPQPEHQQLKQQHQEQIIKEFLESHSASRLRYATSLIEYADAQPEQTQPLANAARTFKTVAHYANTQLWNSYLRTWLIHGVPYRLIFNLRLMTQIYRTTMNADTVNIALQAYSHDKQYAQMAAFIDASISDSDHSRLPILPVTLSDAIVSFLARGSQHETLKRFTTYILEQQQQVQQKLQVPQSSTSTSANDSAATTTTTETSPSSPPKLTIASSSRLTAIMADIWQISHSRLKNEPIQPLMQQVISLYTFALSSGAPMTGELAFACMEFYARVIAREVITEIYEHMIQDDSTSHSSSSSSHDPTLATTWKQLCESSIRPHWREHILRNMEGRPLLEHTLITYMTPVMWQVPVNEWMSRMRDTGFPLNHDFIHALLSHFARPSSSTSSSNKRKSHALLWGDMESSSSSTPIRPSNVSMLVGIAENILPVIQLPLSITLYHTLIRGCLIHDDLSTASRYIAQLKPLLQHADPSRDDIQLTVYVYITLLLYYARRHDASQLIATYQQALRHQLRMQQRYAEQRRRQQRAIHMNQQHIKHDEMDLVSHRMTAVLLQPVFDTLEREGDLESMMTLFGAMRTALTDPNSPPDVASDPTTSLIVIPTLDIYHCLLRLCSSTGGVTVSTEIFALLRGRDHVSPTIDTYTYLLRAFLNDPSGINRMSACDGLFSIVQKAGLEIHVPFFITYIHAVAKYHGSESLHRLWRTSSPVPKTSHTYSETIATWLSLHEIGRVLSFSSYQVNGKQMRPYQELCKRIITWFDVTAEEQEWIQHHQQEEMEIDEIGDEEMEMKTSNDGDVDTTTPSTQTGTKSNQVVTLTDRLDAIRQQGQQLLTFLAELPVSTPSSSSSFSSATFPPDCPTSFSSPTLLPAVALPLWRNFIDTLRTHLSAAKTLAHHRIMLTQMRSTPAETQTEQDVDNLPSTEIHHSNVPSSDVSITRSSRGSRLRHVPSVDVDPSGSPPSIRPDEPVRTTRVRSPSRSRSSSAHASV